jgi:glyoxylase-like metal-dependent hydrolase (beta-lactamase superfamily II)
MRTKLYTAISAALLCASGGALAEDTIPLNAVNRANEVIDAVIETYGGAEAISNLNTVMRKSEFRTWATNQSLRPEPPWDEGRQSNFAAVDLENEIFVGKNAGSTGGFDFNTTQIIKGEEGWTVDNRAGLVTTQPQPDFNTTSGPLIRITAPLLVKQLQERRNTSHWLGEAQFDGRPHDIITLVMEVGPALSLYFDQETHLLSRSERVLPPFGQVDYRFGDYHEIDGIPFAGSFRLFANDEPNLVIDYEYTKVNEPLDQYASLPEGMEVVEGIAPPTEVALTEVEEGVFLVGSGNTYAMFVEMDDHVVAVGATAGIPERIKAFRETVEEKPIRYAVLTHHHNDHLVGVPAWEAEGAEIFTVKAHEQVVRSNATDGDALKLKFVEDRYVFDGGGRTLEIIDIGPTPHSEHLLVAYLPDEGVLFEADHFPNPANGRIPPAQPVTKHLARKIDELGLDVKTIIGTHSPRVASIDDLRHSLALEPKVAMTASP